MPTEFRSSRLFLSWIFSMRIYFVICT